MPTVDADQILPWLRSPQSSHLTQDMRNAMWIIASAPLLDQEHGPLPMFAFPDRDELLYQLLKRQSEKALQKHLSTQRSHFLGSYYEALLSFILSISSSHEVLAQNLQIHCAGKTLGEFDFLLRDIRNQEVLHLEVAVKFYLQHGDYSPAHWLGPNARDRLDLKLGKLTTQQLQLGSQPAAQQILLEQALPTPEVRTLLQGYLFYPVSQLNTIESLPLHAEHGRGRWVSPSQLSQVIDESADRYWCALQDKTAWLAPYIQTSDTGLWQDHGLDTYFAKLKNKPFKPVLLAGLRQEENCFIEQERLFVVPDAWPALPKSPPTL